MFIKLTAVLEAEKCEHREDILKIYIRYVWT